MIWQDVVIAVCQLAFLPSMLPTLLGTDKPALITSVMNAVIVAIITFAMATLGLWFAVITGVTTSGIWVVLAFQKFKINKVKHEI